MIPLHTIRFRKTATARKGVSRIEILLPALLNVSHVVPSLQFPKMPVAILMYTNRE
jgi:hypothetical protein